MVETVLREPMMVAMHESHPLAGRKAVGVADLDGLPLILYPNVPMPGLAQEVAQAFRHEGAQLCVEQEVEDVLTAVALVASGFGLAVTTRSASSLRLPGVLFVPFKSRYLKDLELSCIYRRADTSPVLRNFLTVVHEHAQSAVTGLERA